MIPFVITDRNPSPAKKSRKGVREVVRRVTILRKGLVKKVGWDGGYQGTEVVGEVLVKDTRLPSGP